MTALLAVSVSLTACSREQDLIYTAGTESSAEQIQTSQEDPVAGYIYICGAVNQPGVYPIEENMRICDAVRLAGGFAPGADEEWLNQAEPIRDGEKVVVYTSEETAVMKEACPAAGPEEGASAAGSDGKINLNTATREELMSLTGIGEAKADAILKYRSENGSFSSIEEIQNISGIKSGVFEKIRDRITV